MASNLTWNSPFELLPRFEEKVWGRRALSPFFPQNVFRERIGEVWFTFKENRLKTGQTLGDVIGACPTILGEALRPAQPDVCPLLVKLLFTTERLSVQVHPNDDYARLHHESLGKTEAWHILHAEPDGEVAVGLKNAIRTEQFAEAARSGEIEQLLDWRPVQAGQTIFVPAGTVHAIGAGVVVFEVQENSDITYRLYDYGRPRDLHLDYGVQVSHLGPHRHEVTERPLGPGRDELLQCEYFRLERLRPSSRFVYPGGVPFYSLLTCIRGEGELAGQPVASGQTWFVPAHADAFDIGPAADSEWLLCYTASQPLAFAVD